MATEYTPGVCNINTTEIKSRRMAGYFGLGLTLLIAALLFGFGLNRYLRLVLFIPLFIMAIGFLQAKNKFCVGYAGAGMQNAAEGSSEAQNIVDNQAIAADKKRARTMNLQALGIAVALTIVAVIV